jgi:hypothetical protein
MDGDGNAITAHRDLQTTKHTNRSKPTIRIRKPGHALPREYAGENKAAWDALDKFEQYNMMLGKALEKLGAMDQLGAVLSYRGNSTSP